MMDREQRDLLVVPYIPPSPPRRHLIGSAVFVASSGVSVVGLALADYSAAVTAGLIVTATLGLVIAAALLVIGVRVRHQFRLEMERAVDPVPVQPAGDSASTSVEVI